MIIQFCPKLDKFYCIGLTNLEKMKTKFCENPVLNEALNVTQWASDSKNWKDVNKWNSTVRVGKR